MNETLPLEKIRFDLADLTLQKAFQELNKIVWYPENSQWDGGFYNIKRDEENEFSGFAILYLFPPGGDAAGEAQEVSYSVAIGDEIRQLFDFIQKSHGQTNPGTPFDSVFVTVQKDGRYVVNYEYQDEEVQPDAPPMPEEMTAEYIVQNLHNCLSYNAPDNYQWVWEDLSRNYTADGKTEYGGEFYYSVNEDKSNPQKLEPGEYVYMYNVTEKLFDDFFSEKTANWSRATVEFRQNGSCSFRITERNYRSN